MRTNSTTDASVIWMQGEHDLSTLGEIAALFATALASDNDDVVVDLSGVDFLGVAPLQLMLQVRTVLEQRGRRLDFRDPSRHARHTLEVCDVESVVASTTSPQPATVGASRALDSWVAVPPRERYGVRSYVTTSARLSTSERERQPARGGTP
jgi:anti-anti-sigma factor